MSDPLSDPPQCCICLEEFTRPASLPCGHRFCLSCIGEYWRIHGACRCPLCKAFFPTRPPLHAGQTPGAPSVGEEEEEEAPPLKAGEVPCDLCPAERRAVKSCLACLASYCGAHLEPHYQREDLGRHLLINVVKNLEDSVCGLHGQQLNKFCRSDRTCICAVCVRTEHRGHHIVSVHAEATRMKVKLKSRKAKLQQAIQERLSEVEKMELSAGVRGKIPGAEEMARSNELIGRLEEEMSALQSRSTELDQISRSEDDLRLLQTFLHTSPWTDAFHLK